MIDGQSGLDIGVRVFAEAVALIKTNPSLSQFVVWQFGFKAEGFMEQRFQFLQQSAAQTVVAAVLFYREMLHKGKTVKVPDCQEGQ